MLGDSHILVEEDILGIRDKKNVPINMIPNLNGYGVFNSHKRTPPNRPHGVKHATRDLEQAAEQRKQISVYYLHFHALTAATVLAAAVQKSIPQNTAIYRERDRRNIL